MQQDDGVAMVVAVAAAERVLRAGGTVHVGHGRGTIGVLALDGTASDGITRHLAEAAGQAKLLMSGQRGRALGLAVPTDGSIAVEIGPGTGADTVQRAVDFGRHASAGMLAGMPVERASIAEHAAVELAKRAGLMPVLLSVPAPRRATTLIVPVDAEAVLGQAAALDAALDAVVEARVPLAQAEDTRLVLFRSAAAAVEHVAVVVGDPSRVAAPLCRLHSECLTGDVFGSMRCDCGEQLQGAIAQMQDAGAGVLLYLRQEGRGIGIANKLRAYRLQDDGFDTVDANTHLGFHSDERDFGVAAAMLRHLGIGAVRLLTNNPQKMDQLGRHGIEIVAREPIEFAANRHNRFYLETKARRSGHLLPIGGVVGARRNRAGAA